MPFYQFKCCECGTESEILLKASQVGHFGTVMTLYFSSGHERDSSHDESYPCRNLVDGEVCGSLEYLRLPPTKTGGFQFNFRRTAI